MSRMSDQAKWNDKNRGRTAWTGAARVKGMRVNPSSAKMMVCKECGVFPCVGREECRKAAGAMNRITIYKCKCGKVTSTKKGKVKRHIKRMVRKGYTNHG